MPPIPTGEKNWYIYKIISPSNRTYIGITQDVEIRKRYYRNAKCQNQKGLYHSILKYGFSNHKCDVIDSFYSDCEYALGKEMFWIRSYMCNRSKYPQHNGLNMTDGGRGSLGKPVSEATKEKLRQANLGKKYSEETKKKLSALRKGKKINRVWTEEQRIAQSNRVKGFKHTEEAKRKISEAGIGNNYCFGKKQSPERIEVTRKFMMGNKFRLGLPTSDLQKQKTSERASKPIIQLDLNGNFIKEFPTMKSASSELKISNWSIWKSAKGEVNKPTRFIFKYK